MTGLQTLLADLGPASAFMAAMAFLAGGFAKGVVGFALPLVAMGAMASFLPYEVAVALLILPMLVSNVFQALRDGPRAAAASFRRFWRLNIVLAAVIALSAQLVLILPRRLLYGGLGLVITGFALVLLLGWRPDTAGLRHRGRIELAVGGVSGFFGGVSGIWGPPVTMYLLTTGLGKAELVRAQAISFFVGAAVLAAAHLYSGVLNAGTLPASALLVVPTVAAMFVGYEVQDRLDQRLFRRVTLVVLVLAGLNLLRRALF